MKINLNTYFEIIGDEMIKNLGFLVFLLHESWLEWWNEQLWCFVLWKIMVWSWRSMLGRGYGVEKEEDENFLAYEKLDYDSRK